MYYTLLFHPLHSAGFCHIDVQDHRHIDFTWNSLRYTCLHLVQKWRKLAGNSENKLRHIYLFGNIFTQNKSCSSWLRCLFSKVISCLAIACPVEHFSYTKALIWSRIWRNVVVYKIISFYLVSLSLLEHENANSVCSDTDSTVLSYSAILVLWAAHRLGLHLFIFSWTYW